VRLADVLAAAGVHRHDGHHLEFLAPDVAQEARPVQSYGSSIPLDKAMSEEVPRQPGSLRNSRRPYR
jgi:sulfite oxidase